MSFKRKAKRKDIKPKKKKHLYGAYEYGRRQVAVFGSYKPLGGFKQEGVAHV